MTYLAAPYSHPDPKVRETRFLQTNRAAYLLMKRGDIVFSPISHSHPIEVESGVIGDHEFWAKQDDFFQSHASLVVVLKLDGWKESKGVQREILLATQADIPIEYMEPSAVEKPLYQRRTAYELAAEVTKGERKTDYGDAFENASAFASVLTGVLWRKLKDPERNPITAKESFLCMIGGKIVREPNKHKQDNLTDTIGYAKLIDEDERFSA